MTLEFFESAGLRSTLTGPALGPMERAELYVKRKALARARQLLVAKEEELDEKDTLLHHALTSLGVVRQGDEKDPAHHHQGDIDTDAEDPSSGSAADPSAVDGQGSVAPPPPPGSDGAMPAVAAKAEAEAALAALQGEEKDDGVLESSAPVSASYR